MNFINKIFNPDPIKFRIEKKVSNFVQKHELNINKEIFFSQKWLSLAMHKYTTVLYIKTRVWLLRTPNKGQNMLLYIFGMKIVKSNKMKEEAILT